MIQNEILRELYTVNYYGVPGNPRYIMEFVHTFTPGEKLKQFFHSMPENQKAIITCNHKTKNLELSSTEKTLPGIRLKIADKTVYLHVGSVDYNDEIRTLHLICMNLRLYYPNEDKILEYWRNPDDDFNNTNDYLDKDLLVRSEYLGNIILNNCKKVNSVIEIGCNAGRNLAYLNDRFGYKVAGLEINKNAINLMEKHYPMLKNIKTYIGDVRNEIKKIDDNAYDLVFSMAVLMHLHPDTPDTFWKEIVRISKKYIIIIENECGGTERNWERNYSDLFQKYGVKEIFCDDPIASEIKGLEKYVTRVYLKN